MSEGARADVIVVGLGVAGSSVLHQLARRGVRALGIDRYHPPHDRGSSHGETRITRQSIGEGDIYTPLVLRSHEIWRELEAETGENLLLAVGGLIMAAAGGGASHHGKPDFLNRTIATARRFGIAHEVLCAGEIQRRYPHFSLQGNETGYFEPGAGLLRAERCVAAQLEVARRRGAEIRTGETVLAIESAGDGVAVVTDRGRHHGDRAVVAAGPWLPQLLGGSFPELLKVYRQVLFWFEAKDPEAWAPERSPVFMWMHGDGNEDYIYGFPRLPGSDGVKVASEQFSVTTGPDRVSREVSAGEIAAMYATHVAGRLHGVGPNCLRATSCLYTVTPDSAFLIDQHPARDRITFISACSGHGFKHAPALGEAVAEQIVAGQSHLDLSHFLLNRLPIRPNPTGAVL
jgi:sarcosine oxidase